MRRYRVEISHKGEVVHTCHITAMSFDDAKTHAWEAFDPGHAIGILDTDYTTNVEAA